MADLFLNKITETAEELSRQDSFRSFYHPYREGELLPSTVVLAEIVNLTRGVLFPGFFGNSNINDRNIRFHIGVATERLYNLLRQQIWAGFCFNCAACTSPSDTKDCINRERSAEIAADFVAYLPELRRLLATDVDAAFMGDPAAESRGEVIFCYPAFKAISNYRMAHQLLKAGVPLIPRIITELAHTETGIDIHPGATIGEYFTIDHGTGVVIGATTIIGDHVQLYQGVTLGAKSFPLDEQGNPIKGIPRHPIIEDNVIIYSNATILGRITIGQGATIGGNIWVTEDVPPGVLISQGKKIKG